MDAVLEGFLLISRAVTISRFAFPIDGPRIFWSIYSSSTSGAGVEPFPDLPECTQHQIAVTVRGLGHPEQLLDAIRGSVKLPTQSSVSDDENE